MKILIVNDDGYNAEGLTVLVDALKNKHELYICAPLVQNSGMGHAITISRSINCEKFELDGVVAAYKTDGTPSDCAKIACLHLFKDIKFDLVLSGINNGSNLGHDIVYSGTVSAAHEAYSYGNHAIALSVKNNNWDIPNDYSYAASHIKKYIEELDLNLPPFLYNINYPYMAAPLDLVHAHPSFVAYKESVLVKGNDEFFTIRFFGTPYNNSEDSGNDYELVDKGYATIVPIKLAVEDSKIDPNIKKVIGR